FNLIPAVLSISVVALVVAEYTPVFDCLAYLFYPFTWLVQLPEPFLAAKAVATGVTELMLPALLVVESDLVTRFVIGVMCITPIIYFSTSIPAILSTDIPIGIPTMLAIWFIRAVLSLLITTP